MKRYEIKHLSGIPGINVKESGCGNWHRRQDVKILENIHNELTEKYNKLKTAYDDLVKRSFDELKEAKFYDEVKRIWGIENPEPVELVSVECNCSYMANWLSLGQSKTTWICPVHGYKKL